MTTTCHPGIFIVFEGTEAAGKTTMAKRVIEALNDNRDHGYGHAYYLRELSCTAYGDATQDAFIHPKEPNDTMTEVAHILACKNEMIKKQVHPKIAEGHILVCDRFSRSFLTYQGGLRGIPMEDLVSLMAATGTLRMPDLEIFLTVPEEVRRERRKEPRDHMEVLVNQRSAEMLQHFRDAKDKLPAYFSKEIDASGAPDEVFSAIMIEIRRYLKFHRTAGLSFNNPTRVEAIPDSLSEGLEELPFQEGTLPPSEAVETL